MHYSCTHMATVGVKGLNTCHQAKQGPGTLSQSVSWCCSPSVLWYCWLGLLTCKNRLPYNLYCVGCDAKHYTINQSTYLDVVDICFRRRMSREWSQTLDRRTDKPVTWYDENYLLVCLFKLENKSNWIKLSMAAPINSSVFRSRGNEDVR